MKREILSEVEKEGSTSTKEGTGLSDKFPELIIVDAMTDIEEGKEGEDVGQEGEDAGQEQATLRGNVVQQEGGGKDDPVNETTTTMPTAGTPVRGPPGTTVPETPYREEDKAGYRTQMDDDDFSISTGTSTVSYTHLTLPTIYSV